MVIALIAVGIASDVSKGCPSIQYGDGVQDVPVALLGASLRGIELYYGSSERAAPRNSLVLLLLEGHTATKTMPHDTVNGLPTSKEVVVGSLRVVVASAVL